MIPMVLRPGKDELLYSVVARHGALLGQNKCVHLINDYFGTSVGVTAVDLPRHLDQLQARMPPGSKFDVDCIIHKQTLYPYIVRFAPSSVRTMVRNYMNGVAERRPVRLGVLSMSFQTRRHLMFCPSCAHTDEVEFGCGAWRRVHQLPGVLICPDHGTVLQESRVQVANRGRDAFTALSAEVRSSARRIQVARSSKDILLWFARGAQTLLHLPLEPFDPCHLQARLKDMLGSYRWSRAPSLMHTSALVDDFMAHDHVRVLMEAVGASWSARQVSVALNRLLYREDVSKHPLLMLMVLAVADASIGEFLDCSCTAPSILPNPPKLQPVVDEQPDHPCLDPACHRFNDHRFRLGASDTPVQAPCSLCKIPYRKGARKSAGMCATETGSLWDDMLKTTLSDPGVSVRAAGRALGVGPTTVQRHARRLGVWRDDWKDRPKLQLRSETKTVRLVKKHRQSWTAYLTAGRPVPIKESPKNVFNAYRYLMRNDRVWMRQQLGKPECEQTSPKRSLVRPVDVEADICLKNYNMVRRACWRSDWECWSVRPTWSVQEPCSPGQVAVFTRSQGERYSSPVRPGVARAVT